MILVFFIWFTQCFAQDALLQAIYGNWYNSQQYESNYKNEDPSYAEIPNDSEAEHYSWELGTRDDVPETIIIYSDEPNPCEL